MLTVQVEEKAHKDLYISGNEQFLKHFHWTRIFFATILLQIGDVVHLSNVQAFLFI